MWGRWLSGAMSRAYKTLWYSSSRSRQRVRYAKTRPASGAFRSAITDWISSTMHLLVQPTMVAGGKLSNACTCGSVVCAAFVLQPDTGQHGLTCFSLLTLPSLVATLNVKHAVLVYVTEARSGIRSRSRFQERFDLAPINFAGKATTLQPCRPARIRSTNTVLRWHSCESDTI
jgi:hypothetical protein